MSDKSTIEWTEATWNPATGCDKVSAGCDNCYAERLAHRLQAMGNPRYRDGFAVTLHHDQLDLPLRWVRPRTIFVNSMSDLFHARIPDEFIRAVFATMERASQHVFQVLTKRPRRAARMVDSLPWPPNVWMGTSIESEEFVWRADYLCRIPSAVRFLSCEPLIGPVDVAHWLGEIEYQGAPGSDDGLNWVIVGGESGPGARPMELAWARSIVEQCRSAGVPVFVKQLGSLWARQMRSPDVKGGRWELWPKELRVREMPVTSAGAAQAAIL